MPAVAAVVVLSLSACAVQSGPPGLSTDPAGTADSEVSTGDVSTDEESTPADADATTESDSAEQTADAPASALDGLTFVTTTVTGHELVPDSQVEMTFAGEQLSVQAGCNRMFGRYTLDQDTLQVPMMAQTQMACDEALMAQDQWLIEFLEGGPQVALAEGTLTLTGSDAELELTDSALDASGPALEDTTWVLTTHFSNTANSNSVGMEHVSLAFDGERVRVETGCNRGSANYLLEGGRLTLHGLSMQSEAACVRDRDRQIEQFVLETLEQPLTVTLEGSTLKLLADDGTGLGLSADLR